MKWMRFGSLGLALVAAGCESGGEDTSLPPNVPVILASDNRTRVLAKPQLRGAEGAKLTLNLGDDIPAPAGSGASLG